VLKKYKIRHAKNVINFDETGARVKCARSKAMVILIEIMELYKASPKNRKSVTICKVIRADESEPLPPFIIVLG
jgi:hypothetical protein